MVAEQDSIIRAIRSASSSVEACQEDDNLSTERKRSQPATAKGAKALKDRLLKDRDYLAELDEALKEFKEGKSKTFEDLEMTRQQRRQQSGG